MPTLYNHVKKETVRRVSLPNLYRTVGQMIHAQILVKNAGKLSLSKAWTPHLLAIADRIREHEAKDGVQDFLLEEGERKEFTADSLGGLDPLWFHILASFAGQRAEKDWYAYNSHPWHVLGMTDTEIRGYKGLIQKGITCHMLYGNNTFLDNYALQYLNFQGFLARINLNTPFPKEGYALWICGDYVIESVFPEIVSARFRYMFSNVNTIKQFDLDIFADIFTMKARCKLTVRKQKDEAEKLRTMVKKYM